MNARGYGSWRATAATAFPLGQCRRADSEQKSRAKDLDERAALKPKVVIHALDRFLVIRL
jgi:hypothetical protein